MATQYANGKIVTDGLVLCLNAADKNSYPGSGTTWTDISGNENHVTLTNGPTWNSAGYFTNDVDSYFTGNGTSSIPTGNSSYTMIVWARQNGNWGGAYGLISIGGYGTTNQSNALRTLGSGVGTFHHYWWANDLSISSNTANIGTNDWFMAAASFDGTTRRVWLNGISQSSDTPVGHNVTSTTIQISKTVSTEYQLGDMAAAYIYNRALSTVEMLQNYNAQKSRFGL